MRQVKAKLLRKEARSLLMQRLRVIDNITSYLSLGQRIVLAFRIVFKRQVYKEI